MAKHTPAPWRLEGNALRGPDGQTVAWAVHDDEGNDYLGVNADDAPLLISAPDLLAACEADGKFFKHFTYCPNCGPGKGFCVAALILAADAEMKRWRAIAKAKGEGDDRENDS